MINIKDTVQKTVVEYYIIYPLREVEGPLGPLSNLATEYGLVCPFGGLFQF
jgi:hypothetical protein